MDNFILRIAYPRELGELVAIDDQASQLYEQAGLKFEFAKHHPFVIDESIRWAGAIEEGLAYVAVNRDDNPVGFVALRFVDAEPYLDQISVLPTYMRRGVGTLLLNRAITWSGGRSLWLTTYAHVPWNKPYYERHGFVSVEEGECRAELCAILREQRSVLPDADQRIAMVRRCASVGA